MYEGQFGDVICLSWTGVMLPVALVRIVLGPKRLVEVKTQEVARENWPKKKKKKKKKKQLPT